jgi:hypothetical protein
MDNSTAFRKRIFSWVFISPLRSYLIFKSPFSDKFAAGTKLRPFHQPPTPRQPCKPKKKKKKRCLSVTLILVNRRISTFSLPREKANHGGPFQPRQLSLLDIPAHVTRSLTLKNTTTPLRSPTPTSPTRRFFLVGSGLNLTVWNRRQRNEEREKLIFDINTLYRHTSTRHVGDV